MRRDPLIPDPRSLIPDPRPLIPGLTAIILAGGRSTRMGTDKGSLPFGDESMLERVVRIVRPIVDQVIVVARQGQQTPAGVKVVHDPIKDQGPLAGLAAGLAGSTSDLNIVVACDMPLIKPEVLQRLVSMIGDDDACVAVADGHASALCGVYRSRIADDAKALLDSGERRVMRLLDRIKTKRVDAALLRDIDPDLDTFISVDTPDKYADAIARSCPPDP
jgi:molybdopterin-guanine dinucleotide biosynthesis protein A